MNPSPTSVVLASRNRAKVAELRMICGEFGVAVEELADVGLATEESAEAGLEEHETFEANARAKARWFAAKLPGRVVVADDSGLAVDALNGAPGVRSRRWAGSETHGTELDGDNNALLLRALDGESRRSARFVAVVVGVSATGEWVSRGECDGRILEAPEGSGGFGYDPLFWSTELRLSFGMASREEKMRVSHRGRAMRALLVQWREAER